MRWGMLINLNKCVSCHACVVKCKQEHFLPAGILWGRVLISEEGTYPAAKKLASPVLCNHCEEAACVDVCPAKATQRRDDGIVWVETDKCIGCRYCLVACPYQVRTYYSRRKEYYPGQGLTEFEKLAESLYPLQTGTVTKCNFCMERIDEGMDRGLTPGIDREATPACVIACPAKARYFGDLDDPSSEISVLIRKWQAEPLRSEYGTKPSVYYSK
ncbi:MAG: 4Fe-4S dicluster domain-containing protein [Deltaproteobacteria bacterium]|nr:4Fe-4S dicluster domain-containing protein [Deltaproteobacteria bacterium]MBW2138681.1 4Fe-4S dicluster domain-containing protein [Deltaproteobacteria bacterium]